MGIGFGELIVIALVGLIFVGPKDLPQVARWLGKFIRDVKKTGDGFINNLESEIENPKKYIKDLDGKLQETFPIDEIK